VIPIADERTSLKFKHIGINTVKIVMALVKNQNILRYIKYLDNDPLNTSKPNVSSSGIIDNSTGNGNIFLTKFDESILTEDKIFIFFNPYKPKGSFGYDSRNTLGKDLYSLDILIQPRYWVLQGRGELRAFLIAYEICQSIDQQSIAGIGDVEVIDWTCGSLSSGKYSVLNLIIQVDNAVIKG
jgi:hypothetical protein